MSIVNEGTIDFAGVEENNLVLSMSDHLPWDGETDEAHLIMLQNKINDYLRFIEGGEVEENFNNQHFDNIIIRIIAKYPFSDECIEFLSLSRKVIIDAGFLLEWEFSPSNNG